MSTSTVNQYKSFADQRRDLAEMMRESSDVISALSMDSTRKNLNVLQAKVANDTFKIMVVGTFKNGKSTFINSFLGEEILPAYSVPCTAVINEVKYGTEKRAMLHFRNPIPEELPANLPKRTLEHIQQHGKTNVPSMFVPYEEIEDYVVIPMGEDPNEMLKESPYEKVELFWPLDLLQNGVEIIDSPGLNENGIRTRVTMEYLNKADAILMVLDATKLCSADEMEFIENELKGQNFTDLFFIVNRYDLIPEREKQMIRDFAAVKLQDYTSFAADGIFFVSSLEGLQARMSGDQQLLEHSGLAKFEQRLSRFLTQEKGKVKLAQPARALKQILNEQALFTVIPRERRLLSSSLDDVKARQERIQPQLQELQVQKDQLSHKLELRTVQCRQEIRRMASRCMLDIVDMIPGWVEECKPSARIATLGIPSKIKEQAEAYTVELVNYVQDCVTAYQSNWQREVLAPALETRLGEIFESVETDASKILNQLDMIRVDAFGDPEPEEKKKVSALSRLAGGAMGLATLSPVLFEEGAEGGASMKLFGQGFLRSYLGLFAGVFASSLIGIAAVPVVIAGYVIALLLTTLVADKGKAEKKVKAATAEKLVDMFSEHSDEIADSLADGVEQQFRELSDSVIAALDAEIESVNEQLNAVISEMEKGEENVARRGEVLTGCEEQIKKLSTQLDELIFQLVKG